MSYYLISTFVGHYLVATGANLPVGYTEGSVNVTVTLAEGQEITRYQWYSNTTNSNEGGSQVKREDNPSATVSSYDIPWEKPAGTKEYYYCKVRVKEGGVYVNFFSDVATVTVGKVDPTAPTGLTATVGQTLADVTLPEGWTWADRTQSVGAAGDHTFKANFAGDDTYNAANNVDVTVTVSKADPTAPSARTATVGQTLADVSLPEGWSWVDDLTTSVGEAGEKTFKANFAGNSNYNSASGVDVPVTVSEASVTHVTPVIKLTAGGGETHKIKKDGVLNFTFVYAEHDADTYPAFVDAGKIVTVTGKDYSKQLAENTEFTAVSGSLKLALTKDYLESLKPGDYTVAAKFKINGSVYESSSTFKIAAASAGSGTTPGTGDDTKTNDLVSAAILFLLSLSFIAYTTYDKKFRAMLLAVPAGVTAYFSGSSKAAADGFDDDLPAYDDGFDDDLDL